MSLSLIVDVMTKIDVTRPQQAVLLAMADHAQDDGSRCFPSVDRIAWKMGYKPRAVVDIMRDLRKAGILVEVAPASQHRPTEYRIDLSAAPPKPDFETWKAQHGRHKASDSEVQSHVTPESRGAFSRRQGCIFTSPGVHFHDSGVQSTAPEPSNKPLEEPSEEPSEGATADTGPGPSQPDEPKPATSKRRSRTATTAPDVFPLSDADYDYAVAQGLPRDRVDVETEKFLNRNRARGTTYRDWRAAWRNWIINAVEYGRRDGTIGTNGRPPAALRSGGPYLPPDDGVDWDEEARRAEERRRERIAEIERRGAAGTDTRSHRREAATLPGGTHRPVRVA